MGLFFRKTKKLGRGVNLTVSNKGPSLSVGPKFEGVDSRSSLGQQEGFRFTKKLF